MRIVYLRSNPVNPDSRVEKEVNSLIKNGYQVSIVCWDRSNDFDWKMDKLQLPDGEVDIHRIGIKASFGGGMSNVKALFSFSLKLYTWLKKKQETYDCMHAADLDTGIVARLISSRYNKKYVYDIFDYYPAAHSLPKVIKNMVVKAENKTINDAEFTILCTDQRKEQIEGSNPKKIVIIHNSPNYDILEKARSKFDISSNKSNVIRIGYVGILSRSRLLEEMANVIKQNEDFEFHVGGYGQLEGFFERISKESTNVFFYGKLDYSETLQLEKQVDVLTAVYDPSVPNHRYAAPNKFYESLMLGKPVIMIHNTGVDGFLDQYQLGVTIDFSEQGFEDALEKLRKEKSNWDDIAGREKELFDKFFSWNIMEKRLIDSYKNI